MDMVGTEHATTDSEKLVFGERLLISLPKNMKEN